MIWNIAPQYSKKWIYYGNLTKEYAQDKCFINKSFIIC